jgi:hypothetical protein
MTASRPTHFAHSDGTVSTRNSKTRVYVWAVEEVRDRHAEAVDLEARVVELEEELATFERAVEMNQVIRTTKPWSYPAGASRQEFYLEDPSGGERIWIGAQVVDADGQPVYEAFDLVAEIVNYRERAQKHIASTQAKAQELADGPRFTYQIVRWSERQDSATKALNTFQRLPLLLRRLRSPRRTTGRRTWPRTSSTSRTPQRRTATSSRRPSKPGGPATARTRRSWRPPRSMP